MTNEPSATPPSRGADRLGRPIGEQTGLRQLITERLGYDPVELANRLRQQTPPMSWNRIAQEIMERTEVDGLERIYLTQEAVRRWMRRQEDQPEAA